MKGTPDYSKTSIYKLKQKNNDNSEIYIGHTICWRNRKSNHKRNCNIDTLPKHNFKVYTHIRENGGWDNWTMELVELCSCGNKEEALLKEQHYISLYKPSLNVVSAITSYEEKLEKTRIYAQNNKQQIYETKKKYRKTNKIKYEEHNKIYRENHKIEIADKSKLYYEKNKNRLNQEMTCECGCKIQQRYLNRHKKTQSHIAKIKCSPILENEILRSVEDI